MSYYSTTTVYIKDIIYVIFSCMKRLFNAFKRNFHQEEMLVNFGKLYYKSF